MKRALPTKQKVCMITKITCSRYTAIPLPARSVHGKVPFLAHPGHRRLGRSDISFHCPQELFSYTRAASLSIMKTSNSLTSGGTGQNRDKRVGRKFNELIIESRVEREVELEKDDDDDYHYHHHHHREEI